MIWLIIQFVIGVLILAKAADWFSRAAAHLADLTGLPRLVLGATMVGLVTNLPEFVISSMAAWNLHSEIALGNPLGSIIVNTGLILGLCLVATKGKVETAWIRDHGLPMLLACTVLYFCALYSDITRPVAFLLLGLCLAYIAWSVISAKREPVLARRAEDMAGMALGELDVRYRWASVGVLLLLSIPLLYFSSRWVLSTTISLSVMLNMSQTVIALTMVAVGTSLPELATAMAALRRGHQDTSIGIVLGSNIYNALGVIGVGGLITQLPVSLGNRLFDLPVMLLVLIIAVLPCVWGKAPGRATGYTLLTVYVVYTYSLFTLYGIFT